MWRGLKTFLKIAVYVILIFCGLLLFSVAAQALAHFARRTGVTAAASSARGDFRKEAARTVAPEYDQGLMATGLRARSNRSQDNRRRSTSLISRGSRLA